MTKKYISFSDQAKNIGKKYPRRKYDKIEQESYERDMENLIELQEQYKKENGFGTEETQNYSQGMPQFEGFGDSFLNLNLEPLNLESSFNITDSKFLNSLTPNNLGKPLNLSKFNNQGFNPTTPKKQSETPMEETSLLPSYLSAGAGIVGNLAQMLLDKKPQKLITPTYQPERLDLSEERNLAERQAIESGNIARRNLREGSLSTGQMLANLGVTEAGIQGTKGNVLTGLGTAEKQYNVGATNQANQYAAEAKAKDILINQQLQDAWKQRQLQYLSGAIGTVPQTMADINRIKQQDKYLSQLSTAERNKLKALNAWFSNYYLGEGNIPSFRK